jgi:hypothetical protein
LKHLTDSMAIAAFANLPPTFDSHKAQIEMRTISRVYFLREVAWFRRRKDLKRKDRLQSFSIAFGRWLLTFTSHIAKTGRTPRSKNLRGTITRNHEWKKI